MSGAISETSVQAFKNAMKLIAATFFTSPVIINHRHTVLDANGENPVVTKVEYPFNAIYQYSVGLGGRYHTIERTDIGQILHDEWKVYFYKPDVDVTGLVVDPEADSVTLVETGEEYEIRMWAPSGILSTSEFQFYECTLMFTPGA